MLPRFYQGYGVINRRQAILHRTYHSIQASVNRRFKNQNGSGNVSLTGSPDYSQ